MAVTGLFVAVIQLFGLWVVLFVVALYRQYGTGGTVPATWFRVGCRGFGATCCVGAVAGPFLQGHSMRAATGGALRKGRCRRVVARGPVRDGRCGRGAAAFSSLIHLTHLSSLLASPSSLLPPPLRLPLPVRREGGQRVQKSKKGRRAASAQKGEGKGG